MNPAGLEVRLQSPTTADVQRGAMERTTESVEVSKVARYRREAPLLQRRDHWFILTLDNDSLFVERKNVHVDPLACHVESVIVGNDGCWRRENIPASEDLRYFENALGIDEQLARSQGHKRRIDVHRM